MSASHDDAPASGFANSEAAECSKPIAGASVTPALQRAAAIASDCEGIGFFPLEVVAMDSPRVAWCKRLQVRLHFAPHCTEEPWCAWLPNNGPEDGIPIRPGECGFGETEEDALVNLAQVNGLRLWNEEVPL